MTLGAAPPSPLARLAAWARLGAIAQLEQTYSVPGAFAAGSFTLLVSNIPTTGDPMVSAQLVDGQGNAIATVGPLDALPSMPITFPASLGILSANGYQLNIFWTFFGVVYTGAMIPIVGAFLYAAKQSTISLAFPTFIVGQYVQVQVVNADGTEYTGGGSADVNLQQGDVTYSGNFQLDSHGIADAAFPAAVLGASNVDVSVVLGDRSGRVMGGSLPWHWNLDATALTTSPGPGLVINLGQSRNPPPHHGKTG